MPLHPLKKIKIETPPDGTAIAGKISYDSYDYLQMSLPMGKSSYTRYFTLGGYNSQGGIFSTFNKDLAGRGRACDPGQRNRKVHGCQSR